MSVVQTFRTAFSRFIAPLLVGAIFVCSLLMGVIVGTDRIDPKFLLALCVGATGILLWQYGTRQYTVSILAIMLSGGLVNFFSLPTGTESRIVVSLLVTVGIVGLWLLEMVLLRRQPGVAASPVNKPIMAFAAASMVAFLWSTLYRDPLVWVPGSFPLVQSASLLVNLCLLALVLLVADKVVQIRSLKLLCVAMLGMGALSLLLYFVDSPLELYILRNGARGLFGTWVALLAYAIALYDEQLSKGQRVLLLLLVALSVFRFFVMGKSWLSGWLPMGAGCALLTMLRSRRLFLVAFVIGTLYLAMNFNHYYTRIVLGEEAEGSGTERIELWMTNLNHVKAHLLFGMGPAGYAVYNMSYHPEDARSTHNNYFDILAQTGVVGFVAFLWLLWAFLHTCNQNRLCFMGQRNFAEAFANATFAGCIAMIVAMMLGDWVLPFVYNQTIAGFDNACYSWIFMGGAVALWRIAQRQNGLRRQPEHGPIEITRSSPVVCPANRLIQTRSGRYV